jgi:uncharacterized protein (TIGR03066 family)
MRATVIALAVGLLAIPNSARAADDNKTLIVGVWEIAYSDAQDTLSVGTKMEFTAAGKLKLTAKRRDGKEDPKETGYTTEKEYFVLLDKDGNKSNRGRICLLSKTTLVIHDEDEDKVIVLKRVK